MIQLTKCSIGIRVTLIIWLLDWDFILDNWNRLAASGCVGVVDGVTSLRDVVGFGILFVKGGVGVGCPD
jgi:hypothetical protein